MYILLLTIIYTWDDCSSDDEDCHSDYQSLEDSYHQQDCPLLEEDSSDDESDHSSSSSDIDDSSRKEDIFGKNQLPTRLTSRCSELLLPTDEKLINIIPKKLQL